MSIISTSCAGTIIVCTTTAVCVRHLRHREALVCTACNRTAYTLAMLVKRFLLFDGYAVLWCLLERAWDACPGAAHVPALLNR